MPWGFSQGSLWFMGILERLDRKDGRRGMFIDILNGSDRPKRGDIVQAVGKKGYGTRYQVITARIVKRHNADNPPRVKMMVRVVKGDFIPKRKHNFFEFRWYSRSKKTFEQQMREGM